MRTADFDEHVIQLDMQGVFLRAEPRPRAQHYLFAEWMSEAAKRFGIPILALAHALLAMGLVLTFANATGRNATTIAALIAAPLVHIGILIGTESLVRRDPRLVILIALAIAVEFLAAFILILRQQANFAAARPAETGPRLRREPVRLDTI